jgi:hypothetical protein
MIDAQMITEDGHESSAVRLMGSISRSQMVAVGRTLNGTKRNGRSERLYVHKVDLNLKLIYSAKR